MLFVKEIFCPATTPSTLTSELMSRTWAGGLEPGSHQWNSSHRVGLGVRGEPWAPQGHQGIPACSLSSSVPLGCRSDRPWWEAMGLGMPLSSWLHRKEGLGGVLSPGQGGFWPRRSCYCCCQKGILSPSLMVFFLFGFIFSVIKYFEGHL